MGGDIQTNGGQRKASMEDAPRRLRVDVDIPLADGVVARGIQGRLALQAEGTADDDEALDELRQARFLHQRQRDIGERAEGEQGQGLALCRGCARLLRDESGRVIDGGGQRRGRQARLAEAVFAMRIGVVAPARG